MKPPQELPVSDTAEEVWQKGLNAGWYWTKEPLEVRPERSIGARIGDIDEIVATGADVHVESLDDNCFWIGITKGGRHWTFTFFRESRRIRCRGGEG